MIGLGGRHCRENG
uniref:Uncharacterized protein n=1 Tax=Arundo donax TaxID=35708 RepID=A0A0A9BKG0_ARUDO